MKLSVFDYVNGFSRYFFRRQVFIFIGWLFMMLFLILFLFKFNKNALVIAAIISLGFLIGVYLLNLLRWLVAIKANPIFTEENRWELDSNQIIRHGESSIVKWPIENIIQVEESPKWLYVLRKGKKMSIISKRQAGEDFINALAIASKGKFKWAKSRW